MLVADRDEKEFLQTIKERVQNQQKESPEPAAPHTAAVKSPRVPATRAAHPWGQPGRREVMAPQ
jgi:hypothetical protein